MSLRRRAGVALVLSLTAGFAVHPAPAHATVVGATLDAYETASVSGDPSCAKPAFTGSRPGSHAIPADGRPRVVKLDRTGRAGITTIGAAGTVRGWAARNSWGTHRVAVSAVVAVSAKPSQSSICSVSLQATGAVFAEAHGIRKSWVVVRSTGSSRGGAGRAPVIGVEAVTGDPLHILVAPGSSLTRLVPAGDYAVGGRVTPRVVTGAHNTLLRSASASVSGTVSLLPVGTLRARTGAGQSYVTVGHRNCGNNSTTASFSAAARAKAKRITFYVDGQRRGVLQGTALQRSSLPITGIAPRGIGEVQAVIRLKTGEKRTMRAISWPCG